MIEFKVGPEKVKSFRQGLQHNVVIFLKTLSISYAATIPIIIIGVLTRRSATADFRAENIRLSLETLLFATTLILPVLFLGWHFVATRDAYRWISIDEENISVTLKKGSAVFFKKKIALSQVTGVVINGEFFPINSLKGEMASGSVVIKYWPQRGVSAGLQSLLFLGIREKDEVVTILKLLQR